ncbi:peroxidase 2-like precursor [Cucumis melo]|uniref:Peroxidase n=1 Tax=Cucumis melo TaxID=3656 RepID=Q6UBM4_CUCME|nr:peroxidase 2-like precursor [Cucumis melo]AAR19041.1 netting associated peroxidase [Cucumis melo]
MASASSANAAITSFFFLALLIGGSSAQLSETFYDQTCPRLANVVRASVRKAIESDIRAGAKLIRLHFHDCFVNGCDGSVLLEDAPGIVSELNSPGNQGIQGLEIVDAIKADVEKECPGIVSCADILAQASKDSVDVQGGPSWRVLYGRRDSRIANKTGADSNLASPFETLDQLKAKFKNVGLNTVDLVALSGAHTFGRSRCRFFSHRFANFNNTGSPDPSLNPDYRRFLEGVCSAGADTRANFDPVTPDIFDKNYYTNLQVGKGLLQSDQELFSTPGADTIPIVNSFAAREGTFFKEFRQSMINMGNIQPLTGGQGEIRRNCRRVNSNSGLFFGGEGEGEGRDVM